MYRNKKIFLLIILFLLLSISYTPAFQEKGLEKLTASYVSITGGHSTLWITKEAGLFQKYGIDANVVLILSDAKATPALIGNQVQVLLSGATTVLHAVSQGADMVIVGSLHNNPTFTLMVTPEIKKPEDLRGKKLGVNRFGATGDYMVRRAVEKFGMDPTKDIVLIQVGGQQERMIAMKNRAIVGTVVNPPNDIIFQKEGFIKLVSLADLGIVYAGNSFTVMREYLKKNSSTIEKFLFAIVEGTYVEKTDKEFAIKVMSKYLRTNDSEALESTYKAYAGKSLQRIPYISEEAIESALRLMARENPKWSELRPSSIVDHSFTKKIEKSGIVQKLYK